MTNYIYIYMYNIITEKPAVTEPLPACHFDTIVSNIYVAIYLVHFETGSRSGLSEGNKKSTCKHGTGRDSLASSPYVQQQSEHPNAPSPTQLLSSQL